MCFAFVFSLSNTQFVLILQLLSLCMELEVQFFRFALLWLSLQFITMISMNLINKKVHVLLKCVMLGIRIDKLSLEYNDFYKRL